MLQIYKRTILPEGDFNKVVLQLYWNHTSAWVFSCKFAAYFQNIFSEEHLWTPASDRLSLTIYLIFNFFLSEAKIAKNPLSSLHWSDLILLLIVYSTYVLQLGWSTQVQTGSWGCYFPCCSILRRNFPNFGTEILALRSAERFRGLYFS